MFEKILSWILINWPEILGTIFGILYVILSVKQNILTWLLGLLTSLLYIYVFFAAKFYAQMALQFYYVVVSIYAWILWAKGSNSGSGKETLHVSFLSKNQIILFSGIITVIWIAIYFLLEELTDSMIPAADAFIAALSIVATWMLAKKKLENWIIWMISNLFSIGLYLYQGLYPTSILFFIYLASAVWGFIEWKNDFKRING